MARWVAGEIFVFDQSAAAPQEPDLVSGTVPDASPKHTFAHTLRTTPHTLHTRFWLLLSMKNSPETTGGTNASTVSVRPEVVAQDAGATCVAFREQYPLDGDAELLLKASDRTNCRVLQGSSKHLFLDV